MAPVPTGSPPTDSHPLPLKMSTHGYQQPGHPPAHIDALQSLRGIFAVFIFFHHLDVFPAGGDVGVVFFLMLSGFVMTYGYGGSGGCVAAVGALHSSLAFCAANGAVCLAVVDTLRRFAHGNGLRRRPPHAAAEMASVGARRRAQLQLLYDSSAGDTGHAPRSVPLVAGMEHIPLHCGGADGYYIRHMGAP